MIARYIIDIQGIDEEEDDIFFTPNMFQQDLKDFLNDNEHTFYKKFRIRVQGIQRERKRLAQSKG